MKLILVRHGEAFEGDLTIKGVKQAISAAENLKATQIDAIYCSNTNRAEQTLDEILRLRDDDIKIAFSSLVRPKMKKESLEKLKKRVELFLDDLKYDHEKETVLVVSHSAVIKMFLYLVKKEVKTVGYGELFEIILPTYAKASAGK
ncbi:MAG TPA: phosphoglycerate mutase family protein [Candidatus Woesebacteria bacterium]|nr:phosphoglycerate mutase family protein [Candidatus Woesebacteria bacterium]